MDNQPFQTFQAGGQMPSGQTVPPQAMGSNQPMMAGQTGPQVGQFNQQPQPTARLVPVAAQNNSKVTLFMVIAIVAGLIAVTFIGLFVWMYSQWDTAQKDVDSKVDAAVVAAVKEKADELESQFVEREKQPYATFAGPIDYGELSFEFPKTWSVYEAKDASSGGDYEAYFNPGLVSPISQNTINALRLTIKDQSYDSYIANYDNYVKNGKLTVDVRLVNGENANVYTGELPQSQLQGIATVFRIRDKTAVMQTDAMLFKDDYNKILDTVRFNK
ncbi:hypothetical protein IKD60_02165 [Candidatus Saccharibacteria bacterium]|nr:hypothetical protein [Candidatus Saccharibacteria bacterium]